MKSFVSHLLRIAAPIRNDYRWYLLRILARLRRAEYHLLWVDSNDIAHTVSKDDRTLSGNGVWHFGKVSSGDWDQGGYRLREYGHIYTILKKLIQGRKKLQQIPEFRENVCLIENGGSPDNCTSIREYENKWRKIEDLYHAIRKDGYKIKLN